VFARDNHRCQYCNGPAEEHRPRCPAAAVAATRGTTWWRPAVLATCARRPAPRGDPMRLHRPPRSPGARAGSHAVGPCRHLDAVPADRGVSRTPAAGRPAVRARPRHCTPRRCPTPGRACGVEAERRRWSWLDPGPRTGRPGRGGRPRRRGGAAPVGRRVVLVVPDDRLGGRDRAGRRPAVDDDVGRSAQWLGWPGAGGPGRGAERGPRGRPACGPLGRLVCFATVGAGEVTTTDRRKLVGISQRRTRRGPVPVRRLLAWEPEPWAAAGPARRRPPPSKGPRPAPPLPGELVDALLAHLRPDPDERQFVLALP
jgi:hypothetical protein